MELTREKLQKEHAQMLDIQQAFIPEYRMITNYLLPGRGVYDLQNKKLKRKLHSTYIINDTGGEALETLTSGIHGGMTSQMRPWFKLGFANPALNEIQPLLRWLEECEESLYDALRSSNFYAVISDYYTEYAGFGTSTMYFGEDGDPFRFELMTVGEYAIAVGTNKRVDKLFRTIFMTYRQIMDEFGEKTLPVSFKNHAESNKEDFTPVVQAVLPQKFRDKPYTSVYFVPEAHTGDESQFLRKSGFYEFPFMVARWDVMGNDAYGLGPGSKAINDIKRLQEMEKAFLMAAHKAVNPPVNAPARKQGTIKLLPGGVNYYSNPNETVKSIYDVRFDYGGVTSAIDRTEQKIKARFYNDIFLSASRDPNLSPLKAAEVEKRYGEEKVFKLGPAMERLQGDAFSPIIERAINIMDRKNMLPPLEPELMQLMQNYGGLNVKYISPLAQSQKFFLIQPLNQFLGAVGAVMQFDETAKDKVDTDGVIDEFHDLTGAPLKVLRSNDQVKQIRDTRAAEIKARREQQDRLMAASLSKSQLEDQKAQADITKTYSDAGVNLNEVVNESAPI